MKKKLLFVLVIAMCAMCLLAAGEAFAAENSETVTIGDKEYTVADGTVDFSGIMSADVKEAVKALSGMKDVKNLILGREKTTDLTWDDVKALCAAAPEAVVDYDFKLYDAHFNLNCDVFDLTWRKIEDEGAFVRELIPLMKNITMLNMDTCGVSNEAMAKLRDDFPEIEVIWRVRFGDRYGVLTNTEMILASCPDLAGDITTENDDGLIYCNKVKYLDLGHNPKMTDISFVRYMPDLEVAILAINSVKDFSPLADCPKLEYLELFNTGLSDLSPLCGLKNLRHLNICYNFGITDITPLYSLTGLERLWIGAYDPVPPEQLAKIRKALPNCEIDDTVKDPTEGTWRFVAGDEMGNPRYAPRYAELRKQFNGYDEDCYSIDPRFKYGW